MAEETDITKSLNWRKIVLPVALGLIAAGYLLIHNLNKVRFVKTTEGQGEYQWKDSNGDLQIDLEDASEFMAVPAGDYIKKTSIDLLHELEWTGYMALFGLIAILMVVIRDLGYIYRIRILTDKYLSWRQSFDVIMLWESASALTPSVVGGSGVAIFILNREGINLGRSTAVVFVTAMMDEIFYILMVPAVFLIVGTDSLFPGEWGSSSFGIQSIHILFWIGYSFIVLMTTAIVLSIFWFPYTFKRFLMRVFSIKLLRRWLKKVINLGDEIIISSSQLKGKPISFWTKAFLATSASWTARFFTLNFIILIFLSNIDHLVVYGRQLVMWVIMLISPTPGSSGVAEIALSAFFSHDIIPIAYIALIAIIWRLLTYFPYLFIGAAILPRWLKRTAGN
jgi:hypothetical protein